MTHSSDPVLSADFISDVTAHMNSDHAESLKDYAAAFASIDWADSVQMISMSVTGIELACQTTNGRYETVCIEFLKPLSRPEQVRGALVAMAKSARQTLEGSSKV